ncbi:MAG: hypothetical protein CMG00_00855 [Candidatus Marinimicrobia bacterium]|nr:hypothetical protein [Candidatus Neomarinimicrobiota bacterium]|tara:strand:+ start:3150 stop:3605 length:456 start_codon:yes stop_codon:yes gene_type:complete
MKKLLFILVLFIPSVLFSHDSSKLVNQAIVCEEKNNNFKSMYGFKFIDDESVQILIKNSDTVDVLTDNILKYNKTKEIIYIIGLDENSMINYGFNIFRENLNVWAFNVTALEPFFEGNQCQVFYETPKEFKSFFKSIFRDEIKSSIKIKKI